MTVGTAGWPLHQLTTPSSATISSKFSLSVSNAQITNHISTKLPDLFSSHGQSCRISCAPWRSMTDHSLRSTRNPSCVSHLGNLFSSVFHAWAPLHGHHTCIRPVTPPPLPPRSIQCTQAQTNESRRALLGPAYVRRADFRAVVRKQNSHGSALCKGWHWQGSAPIQTIQALPAVLSLSLPAILADGFPGGDPLSSRRPQIGSPQLMKQLAPGGGLVGCERTSLRSRNPAKAFPRPKSLQLLLPNKRGRPDVKHRSVRRGQSNTPRLVPTINILCLHSLHDLDLLDTAVVRSCSADQGHLGGHHDFFYSFLSRCDEVTRAACTVRSESASLFFRDLNRITRPHKVIPEQYCPPLFQFLPLHSQIYHSINGPGKLSL